MDDMRQWLELHALGEFAESFARERIGLSDLPDLTEDDLRELGLPMGPRKQLLRAVAALTEGGSPERAASFVPAPPSGDAERRQLTVMFADMVGSTELAQRLDPEDLRSVTLTYQDAAQRVIEDHDGFVARYMGDGVLAYFGYPAAHEDDPERAVRAGLALIGALDDAEEADLLPVRIGIATGPVVVGDLIGMGSAQESAVVGETPNLAARLQGLARPNEVVVSEATRALIGGTFRLEPIPPQVVKGFSEPIAPFRVVAELVGRSRFEARSNRRLSPFVGREEEMELLSRRWARAERGEGGAVLLVGEPGIGKSRVVQELRTEALGERGRFLLFQCSGYHRNTAFYPLLSRLESALGEHAGGVGLTHAVVRDYLLQNGLGNEAVAGLLAGALGLGPEAGQPPIGSLDADARRRQTMAALSELIQRNGDDEPLLCVFEDLHWADPSSVELLSHLVEDLEHRSILLIATARPGFVAPWSDLPHCRVVSLPRLEGDHAARLAATAARLSSEAIAQVTDRAGGNPLFIEELAQTWGDRSAAASPAVPATLQDSLTARLDATGPGRAVAQCAAVLGREFDYSVLSAVWDGDEHGLLGGIDAILRAGLLYERTNRLGTRQFSFRHALVRDAAYASLLRERRRAFHRRAAERLMELRQASPRAAPYEVIAHHLSEAACLKDALRYWLLAGEAAAGTSSYQECEAHLRRGLNLVESADEPGPLAEDELELLVLLGPALMARYGYSAVAVGEAYQRARSISESLPDKPFLTPILNGLRLHLLCRLGPDRGIESCRALLAHAESMNDDASRIEGKKAVGATQVWAAYFSEARRVLSAAISLYEAGENTDVMRVDSDSGLTCHSFLAIAEWAAGHPEQARRHGDLALDIANQSPRTFGLGECLSFRALLMYLLRAHPAAVELASEAYTLAEEHNYVLWKALSSLVHGAAQVATDDPEAGLERLHSAYRLLVEMEYIVWQPLCLAELGYGYGRTGAKDVALGYFEESQALMAHTGERFWVPEAYRRQGNLLLSMGRADEAEEALLRAISSAGELGHLAYRLRAATDLARHWLSAGKPDESRALLGPSYREFTEGFATPDLTDARAVLAACE